jgi:hypothetical protein
VQRDNLKPFGDYAPNAVAALERCKAEDITFCFNLGDNVFNRFAFKFFGFHFIFLLIVGALLPLVVNIVFTAAAIRATITVALVVMLILAKFANHNCPQNALSAVCVDCGAEAPIG